MVTLKFVKEGVGYVAEYYKDVVAATEAVLAHTDLDESYPVTIVDGKTVIRKKRNSLIVLPPKEKPKEKKKGKG